MEFIRPKTSKLDSIETNKQNLNNLKRNIEEDTKTNNQHRNLNFSKEGVIRMNNLATSGSEYEKVPVKQSQSTMANHQTSNSPGHESVLAASSKVINKRRYYNNESSNYYNDFNNHPRRIIQHSFAHHVPKNSHRQITRRVVVPTNRLSSSHKSLKRRRRKKKRPDFDLSFNNTSSIKQSRSKGHLSILQRRNKISLRKKKDLSTTFIK